MAASLLPDSSTTNCSAMPRPEFRELWQRRPHEVVYHYGDSSEEACVLYACDVTLEDEPGFYLSALSSWLIEHGYVLQARP